MIDCPWQPSALHEDTLVHTSRGLIPIYDVRQSDTAFSLDEATNEIRPAQVIQLVRSGRCELFELKVGTRTIRTTGDLVVLALIDRRRPGRQRRRYGREWTRITDLKLGDIVGVARKTPDLGMVQQLSLPTTIRDGRARVVHLPETASDDLLWWAGLYAGDGYVHNAGRRHRRVEFAIPATQPDVRDELIRVTRRLFEVDARPKDRWRVVVPGVRIVDFVEAVGLRGKALEKRIPGWVFRSPEPHRLAFLGGYVDADGSIRTPNGRGTSKDMGLTSANSALLEDARRLAVTCGVRTSTIWDFRSRHPTEPSRWMTGYRMQFSGDFDKISCRSDRRITRMRKRKFFHTDTCVGDTTIKSHTSPWLGFGAVDRVTSIGSAPTYTVIVAGLNLVAERLIVRPGRAACVVSLATALDSLT